MEKFNNNNSINFIKWILMGADNCDQVVFYFLSKKNATSQRYFPLFEATNHVRIVYLNGLSLKYTDFLMLKIFWLLVFFFRKKSLKYRVVHTFTTKIIFESKIQVLHIDDPLYSEREVTSIRDWEAKIGKQGNHPVIVCTNSTMTKWFKKNRSKSKFLIVEQGFSTPARVQSKNDFSQSFKCVYSSQYIHFGNDRYSQHSTWGANLLIGFVIPRLYKLKPDLEIHIIGELGNQAKQALKKFKNVITHGALSGQDNMGVIQDCDLGIYPRQVDHKRSILKIYSYIGAGIPIVGFDLIDTKIVKDYNLGVLVKSKEELIDQIIELSKDNQTYLRYKSNVHKIRNLFTWNVLAHKLEKNVHE
jgi:hypothetical protein